MKKNRIQRLAALVAVNCLALAPGGCVPTIPGASPDLLAFLETGTSREEVLLKLGQPSASFEEERILTYRVGEDSRHGQYIIYPRAMQPWQRVRYSLVLVFDSGGKLQKQKLVTVE